MQRGTKLLFKKVNKRNTGKKVTEKEAGKAKYWISIYLEDLKGQCI